MTQAGPDTLERFNRLRELQAHMWKEMSPAYKDRILQIHLAAAYSPAKKLRMICEMTDSLKTMRQSMQSLNDEGVSDGR